MERFRSLHRRQVEMTITEAFRDLGLKLWIAAGGWGIKHHESWPPDDSLSEFPF